MTFSPKDPSAKPVSNSDLSENLYNEINIAPKE